MPEPLTVDTEANYSAEELARFNATMDAAEAVVEQTAAAPQPDDGGTQAAPAQPDKPTEQASDPGKSAGTPTAAKPEDGKVIELPKQDGKEPSKYAKELERRDKSWKALNAEKEQLAKERAEWKAQQDEAARIAQERATQSPPEFTPEDYEAQAEKWEADGKLDLAEEARKEAKRLRSAPPKPNVDQQAKLQVAHRQAWAEVQKAHPEIADPASPLRKGVVEFLANNPELNQFPNAPKAAAEFVAAKLAAAGVPALQAEKVTLQNRITELEQQLKQLETRTSIAGGSAPTVPGGPRSWEQLTDAEREAQFERELHSE
jgi:hypothetical protein